MWGQLFDLCKYDLWSHVILGTYLLHIQEYELLVKRLAEYWIGFLIIQFSLAAECRMLSFYCRVISELSFVVDKAIHLLFLMSNTIKVLMKPLYDSQIAVISLYWSFSHHIPPKKNWCIHLSVVFYKVWTVVKMSNSNTALEIYIFIKD